MERTDNQALNPWPAEGGGVISCTEKIKVLDENLREIQLVMQEALDDAVLMGCDVQAVCQCFSQVALNLNSSY